MAFRLLIHGRVQGVGYRESMRDKAERLRIRGWVRNRFDGTVEAVIDGNEADIQTLLAWARRGPTAAHVTELVSEPCILETTHQGFQRRATA